MEQPESRLGRAEYMTRYHAAVAAGLELRDALDGPEAGRVIHLYAELIERLQDLRAARCKCADRSVPPPNRGPWSAAGARAKEFMWSASATRHARTPQGKAA